jgi:hypothetical protein
MAGAYCMYCARRCFVSRQVVVSGVVVRSGHMATCERGKQHDRDAIGMDSGTAHNPVWDGCECPNVCGPGVSVTTGSSATGQDAPGTAPYPSAVDRG